MFEECNDVWIDTMEGSSSKMREELMIGLLFKYLTKTDYIDSASDLHTQLKTEYELFINSKHAKVDKVIKKKDLPKEAKNKETNLDEEKKGEREEVVKVDEQIDE
jgi:hypothetical protein